MLVHIVSVLLIVASTQDSMFLFAEGKSAENAQASPLLCTACDRLFLAVEAQLTNYSVQGVRQVLYRVCGSFKMTSFCTVYIDPYIDTIYGAIMAKKNVCVALNLCDNPPPVQVGQQVVANIDNLYLLDQTARWGFGKQLAVLNTRSKMPPPAASMTSVRGIDCRAGYCAILVSEINTDPGWVLALINKDGSVSLTALPRQPGHSGAAHQYVGPWYDTGTNQFVLVYVIHYYGTLNSFTYYYNFNPADGTLTNTFQFSADWANIYDAVLWNGWLVFTNSQFQNAPPQIYILDLQTHTIIRNFTTNANSGFPVHLCQDTLTNKIYATQFDVFIVDLASSFSSVKLSPGGGGVSRSFSSVLDDCAIDPTQNLLLGHSTNTWYQFDLATYLVKSNPTFDILNGKVAFKPQ